MGDRYIDGGERDVLTLKFDVGLPSLTLQYAYKMHPHIFPIYLTLKGVKYSTING